jgi:RNA polymerase sigma-70 factor (ECF subfamily)
MTDAPTTRPSLLVRLRDPKDERAWAEFLEVYEPLIQGLARRKGLQKADADDLAQEVFRAVAGAIGRYDPDPARGSFRGWLFRIARNLMVNLLVAQGRHPRGAGGTDLVQLLEAQPAPEADETALFDAEYRRRLFTWASERVRPAFRDPTWRAFWRTGVEGEDVAAVAASLGLSPGAVYIARSRVMARIRREIEELEGG